VISFVVAVAAAGLVKEICQRNPGIARMADRGAAVTVAIHRWSLRVAEFGHADPIG
jgi:hypothetical protein